MKFRPCANKIRPFYSRLQQRFFPSSCLFFMAERVISRKSIGLVLPHFAPPPTLSQTCRKWWLGFILPRGGGSGPANLECEKNKKQSGGIQTEGHCRIPDWPPTPSGEISPGRTYVRLTIDEGVFFRFWEEIRVIFRVCALWDWRSVTFWAIV